MKRATSLEDATHFLHGIRQRIKRIKNITACLTQIDLVGRHESAERKWIALDKFHGLSIELCSIVQFEINPL